MTASTMVTLKDGSQVSSALLSTVTMNLTDMLEGKDIDALVELVEKCKDNAPNFEKNLSGRTKETLKSYGLIGQNDRAYTDLQKIVFELYRNDWFFIKSDDPIKREISQI